MGRMFSDLKLVVRLYRSELWVPMSLSAQALAPEADASWYLGLVGRLKPRVTAAQAQEDAERVAQQIMRSFPPDEANFRIRPVVYPLEQITADSQDAAGCGQDQALEHHLADEPPSGRADRHPHSRFPLPPDGPHQKQALSCFAAAAVLLAMLGIYSIIAFSVASRLQEMAIRMALGSQRSHIVRLVLLSGLKMAAVGCVLGLAGSIAASRLLRSFLFHVSPFDPIVLAISAVVIFLLAIAASTLPAQKAASVDPLEALRTE